MSNNIEKNQRLVVRMSDEDIAKLGARAKRAGFERKIKDGVDGNISDMVRSLLYGEDVLIIPLPISEAKKVREKIAADPDWARGVFRDALYGRVEAAPVTAPTQVAASPFASQKEKLSALAALLPKTGFGVPRPDHAITVIDNPVPLFEPEPEESPLVAEFGRKAIADAPRVVPGWKKMSDFQRAEFLRDKRERETQV